MTPGVRSLSVSLAIALSGATGWAQHTYTVTSAADAGVGTLRAAVAAAEADVAADVIVFDALLAGQTITLTAALEVTESLTIDGAAAPGLTLSGGWDGISFGATGTRLFSFPPNASRVVTLRDLVLEQGNAGPAQTEASDPAVAAGNGGLVFLSGGTLAFEGLTVRHGTAHDGGLVFVYDGDVVATNTAFVGGRARDDGGAVDLHLATAKFTATNCTFYDNVAGYDGGTPAAPYYGSCLRATGDVALDQCTFAYNRAPGSTLYHGGELRVSRSVFTANAVGVTGRNLGGPGALKDRDGADLTAANAYGHNYADDADTLRLNVLDADAIALGPLVAEADGTLTAALDCGSALEGVVASPAVAADALGRARGGAGEPGARELAGCRDVDGDGTDDVLDADTDGDSVADYVERAGVSAVATTPASDLGAGPVDGRAHVVAGLGVAYAVRAGGGALAATATTGVLGGEGLEIASNATREHDGHVVEIAFARPVYDLAFDLADLDRVDADRTETVFVECVAEGRVVALRDSNVALGANVGRLGNAFFAVADVSTDGKVDASTRARISGLTAGVDTLRLTFSAGPRGADPDAMTFYVANVAFRRPDSLDLDGDGLPHHRDVDADGDGLLDELEAVATVDYDAAGASASLVVAPVNTDGDPWPDFLDADADDDGEPDRVEGHDTDNDGDVDDDDAPAMATGRPIGVDVDGDGLDDGFDAHLTAYGGFGPPIDDLPESDNTAELDYRDPDANIAGVVFHDVDGDGGFGNPLDERIAGATVELRRELPGGGFGPPLTAVTDGDGRYLFAAGGFGNPLDDADRYQITVVPPGGFGPPTLYRDPAVGERHDSDLDPGTGATPPFSTGVTAPAAFVGAGFTSAPLPVAFTAVAVGCPGAAWSVADERDVRAYVVERRGGDGAWASVAEVPADGGPHYLTALPPAGSEAYYRVVAVDLDGARDATDAAYAGPCGQNDPAAPRAFPNPARAGQRVWVAFGGAGGGIPTLADAAGRPVGRVTDGRIAGEYAVDTAGLPAGVYFARLGGRAVRVVIR